MKINQGACVGVLYVGNGKDQYGNPINEVKIHNGKLKCAYYKGKGWVKNIEDNSRAKLPERVCVIHYNIRYDTKKDDYVAFSECRILNRVLRIEKTPDEDTPCTGETFSKPIQPGRCIGYKFKYISGSREGDYDVKNGKFLYAKKTNQSKITCELDEGKQKNIEYLDYMHWNIKAENGVVKMFAEEKRTGDNIKIEEIYRTTLTPTEGSCKCNC
ncbi:MAG: hypothetical protein ACM3KR_01975 [Deltaproteobacteria bacterium]